MRWRRKALCLKGIAGQTSYETGRALKPLPLTIPAPTPRKRDALTAWLADDLPQRFEHRVLLVDAPIALAWGDLMGNAKRKGHGLSSMDGLIAATAIAYQLTLATPNIKDFEDLGIELVDRWVE